MSESNLLTQDEAENCWCPFARAYDSWDAGDGATATNRPLAYHHSYSGDMQHRTNINCIGSNCMAWRWCGENEAGEDVGYCGLAGPPSTTA
jgi:hypothetical protein